MVQGDEDAARARVQSILAEYRAEVKVKVLARESSLNPVHNMNVRVPLTLAHAALKYR